MTIKITKVTLLDACKKDVINITSILVQILMDHHTNLRYINAHAEEGITYEYIEVIKDDKR